MSLGLGFDSRHQVKCAADPTLGQQAHQFADHMIDRQAPEYAGFDLLGDTGG